jgi:VIT1/CCC1 family predicted Fe2+/Mn2+ transporter
MFIANNIVEVIQLMLAPGLMISACGLLLLGMNNKYSLVVNRIRLLNDEKRKILGRSEESDTTLSDNVRLESISIQIEKLVYRVKLVKRAVQNYTIAVALFILTSILIGISYLFKVNNFQYLITVIFLFGMLLVLAGAVFAAYETKKGFEIINLEVNAE